MNPVEISMKMQNVTTITNEHNMPEISGSARRNTTSLEVNISLISLKTATFKRSHRATVHVVLPVVVLHVLVLLQVVLALLFPAVTCLSVRFAEVSVGSVFHGEFPPFPITTEAQHECCGLKAFYCHLHVST